MQEKKKYLALTALGGIVFIVFTLVMEWLSTEVLENAQFTGSTLLTYLTRIFKIIGEAGVVACIIGLLIEYAHFLRFYETLVRRALVDEEYLRKFSPSTLDGIMSKSYRIRNENKITNPIHLWEDQFDFAWKNLKELPIQAYYTGYTHQVDHFFYSKNQLQSVDTKLSEKFPFLPDLKSDIFIIKETKDYDLISPYLKEDCEYLVSSHDLLAPFTNIPNNINLDDFLVYEIEKDDQNLDLKKTTDYSSKTKRDGIFHELHHKTKVGPKCHFCISVYSVEPQVDNFYIYLFEQVVADKATIYFTSNVELSKLDYEFWFVNQDENKFEEIEKGNRRIIFEYRTWVFPRSGYMVVWQK